MKKLLPFVLCIILISTTSCCYAASFNIDDYTSAELASIHGEISKELYDCIIVPQGFYVVGKDLPAGQYCILKNSELPGDDPEYCWIALFNSKDDYLNETSYWSWDSEESKCVTWCNTLWGGETWELSEGMVIAIGFGTAGIRKVETSVFSSFWD